MPRRLFAAGLAAGAAMSATAAAQVTEIFVDFGTDPGQLNASTPDTFSFPVLTPFNVSYTADALVLSESVFQGESFVQFGFFYGSGNPANAPFGTVLGEPPFDLQPGDRFALRGRLLIEDVNPGDGVNPPTGVDIFTLRMIFQDGGAESNYEFTGDTNTPTNDPGRPFLLPDPLVANAPSALIPAQNTVGNPNPGFGTPPPAFVNFDTATMIFLGFVLQTGFYGGDDAVNGTDFTLEIDSIEIIRAGGPVDTTPPALATVVSRKVHG